MQIKTIKKVKRYNPTAA